MPQNETGLCHITKTSRNKPMPHVSRSSQASWAERWSSIQNGSILTHAIRKPRSQARVEKGWPIHLGWIDRLNHRYDVCYDNMMPMIMMDFRRCRMTIWWISMIGLNLFLSHIDRGLHRDDQSRADLMIECRETLMLTHIQRNKQ